MPTISEDPFITLIAHEPNHEINNQLSSYFGNLVVLTHTQVETIDAIRNGKYKLFILDLNLIGIGVIRLIKNTSGCHHDTPVIALTDEEIFTQRKQLIAEGFDDCLPKPLTIEKIDDAINLWLNQDGLDSPITAAHNLLSKCRYNRKLAATLYSKIFEKFPERLEALDLNITSGNYQTAYDVTHALDSEARICFLNNISMTAKNLGGALKNENHHSVQTEYEILNQRITDLISQRQMLLAFLTE
jgi:DNA-binding response OmpR family regulator